MAITYNTSVNVKGALKVKGENVALQKDLTALEDSLDTVIAEQVTPVTTKVEELETKVASGITNSYEVTVGTDQTQEEALDTITATLADGDTAILKEEISSGKYSYTAYVRDEGVWKAMDGNYDASNVYFDADITLAGEYTQVGNLTKTKTGTATLEAKGKSVKEVLSSIFTKTLQPATPTQPAVTITLTNAGSKEVGSSFTPSYTASLSAGSYTYGPATGVTVTEWTVYNSVDGNTEGNTLSTATGTFDSFTVGDNTNYTVTAMALHTEGAIAKNNVGGDSDPIKRIAAATDYEGTANTDGGHKTKTSSAVTGYRNWYVYIGDDCTSEITSSWIRSTTAKGNAKNASTLTEVSIPATTKRVMIALPAGTGYTKKLSSVIDVDGMGLDVFANFVDADKNPITVNVEGANGYDAMAYNVYVSENANCFAATRYTFNIA